MLIWCGSVKREFQRRHRRGSMLGASKISIKEWAVSCWKGFLGINLCSFSTPLLLRLWVYLGQLWGDNEDYGRVISTFHLSFIHVFSHYLLNTWVLSTDDEEFIEGTLHEQRWQYQVILRMSKSRGFPGGTVVENPPASAGDVGSSPGLGRSHMPWSN